MLRNNFRTKLLGIITVPLAGLVAITAFAGFGRWTDAKDAAKVRNRIDVIAAATQLAHQVQLEQAASANVVANPNADRADLLAQRTATDKAVQTYRDVVSRAGDVSSTAFDVALDRVRRNLNALATSYRGAIDLGTDTASMSAAFAEIGSSISDLIGTVADEATDPSLAREASALAALSHAKDAAAKEWAVLDVALSRGAFVGAEQGTFQGAVADRAKWMGIQQGLATPESRSALQVRLSGPAIGTSEAIERDALSGKSTFDANGTPIVLIKGDVTVWNNAMHTRLDLMNEVVTSDTANLAAHASSIEQSATKDLETFLFIAAAAVLASTALALVLARRVTTPLRQLRNAAERLADEQLPALVNGLRHPGEDDENYLVTTLTPIEVTSHDEIGQLARAFNTVQTVAVDVAAEQATLLRKGISEIFVNLARRNQVLIDRQIEFLDELEATEDDPDQLAQLYRLDHLATRMRRNAESLLVLSGHEPARTRSRPVPLFDVVRAAIGEVEDFSRIELASFDDVDVLGNAAVDLGHLLAELMDNAAHFSPPDTQVTVEGRQGRAGYSITITDLGIGMTDEQLAEANELLASPPPVGLALGRSLGFTVVGRLAARYGVSVRLLSGEQGTKAIVHLPQHVIASNEADEAWAQAASAEAAGEPDPVVVVEPEPAREPVVEHVPEPVAELALEPVEEPASEPSLDAWVDASAPDPTPAMFYDQEADEAFVDATCDVTGANTDEFESVMRAAWGDADTADAAPDEMPDDGDRERDRAMAAWVEAFGEGADAVVEPLLPAAPAQPTDAPASLRDALPQGASFDEGLAALVHGDEIFGPPQLIEPPVVAPPTTTSREPAPEPPAFTESAPSDKAAGVGGDLATPATPGGLTRRVRRTLDGVEGLDRFRAAPSGPSILATKRSPDDVRAMLARYRTGLQRGRAGEAPIEPEAEKG